MSFGFSIGDIVLLSQLSYQIYKSLTSGRRSAGRDLQELADVLFGLRCSLEHLRTVSKEAFGARSASPGGTANIASLRENVEQMIENTAKTLEDLDSATKKYREGAVPIVVPGQSKRAALKQRLTADWTKVRWDMEKETLRAYRDKLQSHTDAMNLLLNSILWSTTHQSSVQIDALVQNSQQNMKLMQNMHDMLKTTSISSPIPMPHATQLARSGHVQDSVAFHVIDPTSSSRPPAAPISTRAVRSRIAQPPPVDLPQSVLSLNAERQAFTPKQMAIEKQQVQDKKKIEVTYDDTVATPPVLIESLRSIFAQSPVNNRANAASEGLDTRRRYQIDRWLEALNRLVDARLLYMAPAKRNAGLIDILVFLNSVLEDADKRQLQMFFDCSRTANIDQTFEKLVVLTQSVWASKEIDDFKDTREEFRAEM